ncbi:MAG: NAD(P)H-hydrate dehydratase [Opitutales bacterium]
MMFAHPFLSCRDARAFEERLLGEDEDRAWLAMQAAGSALGRALLRDFWEQTLSRREGLRLLILCGKGHNGGDALIAAATLMERVTIEEVCVVASCPMEAMKPLTRRAYEHLAQDEFVTLYDCDGDAGTVQDMLLGREQDGGWDLVIDGLLGMQFSPPLREPAASLIRLVNRLEAICLRAAVDLPTGVGDETDKEPFRADFTYATGIPKAPLLNDANASVVGRIRYLDIDFFRSEVPDAWQGTWMLTEAVMEPIRRLRDPFADKRAYGHLFILAGSRTMPGALLMAAEAAAQSGVGLITLFAPESIAPAFASVLPEAMWVPWPETPEGSLAWEGRHLLRERLDRCTGLLVGPGMGRETETQKLIGEVIRDIDRPLVLDADALFAGVGDALADRPADFPPAVLTPHAGEFERIGGGRDLMTFTREHPVLTVLKGPRTRICDGHNTALSGFGGPVLARGGSGDVLAGLLAGQVAQGDRHGGLFERVCRAVVWHGLAADALARRRGQVAVRTGDLIDHLGEALIEHDGGGAP